MYEGTVELLRLEMERGHGMFDGARANITLADNLSLRGECVMCVDCVMCVECVMCGVGVQSQLYCGFSIDKYMFV